MLWVYPPFMESSIVWAMPRQAKFCLNWAKNLRWRCVFYWACSIPLGIPLDPAVFYISGILHQRAMVYPNGLSQWPLKSKTIGINHGYKLGITKKNPIFRYHPWFLPTGASKSCRCRASTNESQEFLWAVGGNRFARENHGKTAGN